MAHRNVDGIVGLGFSRHIRVTKWGWTNNRTFRIRSVPLRVRIRSFTGMDHGSPDQSSSGGGAGRATTAAAASPGEDSAEVSAAADVAGERDAKALRCVVLNCGKYVCRKRSQQPVSRLPVSLFPCGPSCSPTVPGSPPFSKGGWATSTAIPLAADLLSAPLPSVLAAPSSHVSQDT